MSEEAAVATAEPKAAPTAEPAAAPAPDATSTPTAGEVKAADGALDPNKTYTQAEVDKIVKAAKKNTRHITRREVEAFYQGRESAAPKPAAKTAEPPPEDKPPTRDQFESYEAFLDAKAEYTGKRAAQEYRAKEDAAQRERSEREAAAERVKTFQSKVNAKYPDLPERAEIIAHVEMPNGMGEAISESEFGPDILNHFVENPKDFERIAALSPSAAIREVGRLEARLEGAAKPTAAVVTEVKQPSKAPAPLKPVGGTAVAGDGEPSHDDPDAWRKWRDKQVHAKRTAGRAR